MHQMVYGLIRHRTFKDTDIRKKLIEQSIPNRKSNLSMKRTPKPRSRNYSKRYARAKSVSCSALHRRWEPGRMCRIKSLLPTTSTALGVRQIWNSGQEERSGRATKIRRYTSTAMLRRTPSTHICISLWRENRSLQVR